MSMSHIYQPLMIKTLLERGGSATKTEIAKKILELDISQVEYYESITNNMVGRVLRKNNIVTKESKQYNLINFKSLSATEIQELIDICDKKISEYSDKRGNDIWEHRRRNRRPVPGSIRYEVLKRAKGRCELCGISKEEKALEVDHITPKNLGGEDSIDNYQALCYTCNSNKSDKDDTDFRNLNALYSQKDKSCVFCNLDQKNIKYQTELCIAFEDKYPVSKGHLLITPKRHCKDYFELSQAEINAMTALSHKIKDDLVKKDSTIEGFNIGFNTGEVAGQTIFHCHLHIIPRRQGDSKSPIGGIRKVINGDGAY